MINTELVNTAKAIYSLSQICQIIKPLSNQTSHNLLSSIILAKSPKDCCITIISLLVTFTTKITNTLQTYFLWRIK